MFGATFTTSTLFSYLCLQIEKPVTTAFLDLHVSILVPEARPGALDLFEGRRPRRLANGSWPQQASAQAAGRRGYGLRGELGEGWMRGALGLRALAQPSMAAGSHEKSCRHSA